MRDGLCLEHVPMHTSWRLRGGNRCQLGATVHSPVIPILALVGERIAQAIADCLGLRAVWISRTCGNQGAPALGSSG